MAGRCGVTASGAKGIVFEIMDKDLMNLMDVFKSGMQTSLTKSPNATTVDLVTTNGGKVVRRIQCKDVVSESGVNNVLNAVKNGKYQSATLHGTTESANAFNAAAEADNVSKRMINTGISDKTTQRIANKSLGNVSGLDTAAAVVGKAALIGCLVNGTIATVQCIKDGKNVPDSVGHVTVSAGMGAVSYGASAAAAEAATAALIAASAPTLTVILIPAGCAVGTAIILNIALNFVSDDAEDFISNLAAKAGNAVQDIDAHVREWIQTLEVKENILEGLSAAKQKTSVFSNEVGQKIQAAYKRITH